MKYTSSIKKNHIFKRLYHKGNSGVAPFLAMYTLNNGKQRKNENFLGITVGVKLGNAVTRNKVRRRIREIYRAYEPSLVTGKQIVIVARNRCATGTFSQIETNFLRLCVELDLFLPDKIPETVKNYKKSSKPNASKNTSYPSKKTKNPNQQNTKKVKQNVKIEENKDVKSLNHEK